MATTVNFFDGAESSTTPVIGNLVASNLIQYANDAAYEAAESGAPTTGNIYYNTTLDLIRYYSAGAWSSIADEDSTQTFTAKTIDGASNTITNVDGDEVVIDTITNLTATDAQAAFAEQQGDIDDIHTASGTSGTDMGTYSGTTISDNQSQTTVNQELETAVEARIPDSEKGAANGVATLDGSSKIPSSQLPTNMMEYQGDWNATTNTPTLDDTDTGAQGNVYKVTVAGTVDFGAGNITFAVGDWVYNNGTVWNQSDEQTIGDTDDLTEGSTNLYYTEARVDANTNVTANTAKTSNATHTGDATGATALTLASTAITGKASATVASGDTLLISDLDDSGNLKEVTAQSIADLGGGGGTTNPLQTDLVEPLNENAKSVDFDGANEYARITHDATTFGQTNNVSMSWWVKSPNQVPEACMLSQWEDTGSVRKYRVSLNLSGLFEIIITQGGSFPTNAKRYRSVEVVADDTWRHLAWTFASNVLKMYIDGVEITPTKETDNTVNTLFNSTSDILIAARNPSSGPSCFLEGKVDDISYWDKELTSSDVSELYNKGCPLSPEVHTANANLKAYYRMGDSDTYPTLTDYTSGQDATMTNMESGDLIEDVPKNIGTVIRTRNKTSDATASILIQTGETSGTRGDIIVDAENLDLTTTIIKGISDEVVSHSGAQAAWPHAVSTVGSFTSIAVPPGKWRLNCYLGTRNATAVSRDITYGISTSSTVLTPVNFGDNLGFVSQAAVAFIANANNINDFIVDISVETTYYLVGSASNVTSLEYKGYKLQAIKVNN